MLLNYLYEHVIVKTRDGRTLQGRVIDYESAIEHGLESDEIAIDLITHHEVVAKTDITEIKIVC